jgi:hypothetical protein
MEASQLLFWKAGPHLKLTAPEVARELVWGEEVEGLVDLPIREIIDRLKAEFPEHEEKPGLLVARAGSGLFEATWSWQYVKVDCRGLATGERERLIDAVESFDCMAFENKTKPLGGT